MFSLQKYFCSHVVAICSALPITFLVMTPSVNSQDSLLALNPQFNQNYAVISRIGLNVRDRNCELKGRLTFGSILKHRERGSNTPILCTINNVVYTMYPVQFNATDNNAVYVAVIYLRQIHTEFDQTQNRFELSINSSIGLNVRNKECQLIKRVADRAKLRLEINNNVNMINCDLGGQTYAMTEFKLDDNTEGYIATSFLM